MPGAYALATGPITGRIPHGDGFLDVTADYLFFDSEEEAQAAAESIELEHATRGSHPLQDECATLSEFGHPDDSVIAEHQKAHKALNKKAGL